MVAEPAAMKLKEIKAELDELGVVWKGVYFERDDLARALMTARARSSRSKYTPCLLYTSPSPRD